MCGHNRRLPHSGDGRDQLLDAGGVGHDGWAARIASFGEPDPADPVHDLVGGQLGLAPLGEHMS